MFNIFKMICKHVAAWFMIMSLMFFTAAPIARTDLKKWLVVVLIALFVSEVSISIVEHGNKMKREAAR